jgi:hypothetical protein
MTHEHETPIVEASTQVEQENPTTPQHPQQNVLFGTISYADDSAYEEFISSMNISQAIFVLVASANSAQAKGAYNLLESETIATAIRTIRKNSESQETPEASEAQK